MMDHFDPNSSKVCAFGSMVSWEVIDPWKVKMIREFSSMCFAFILMPPKTCQSINLRWPIQAPILLIAINDS